VAKHKHCRPAALRMNEFVGLTLFIERNRGQRTNSNRRLQANGSSAPSLSSARLSMTKREPSKSLFSSEAPVERFFAIEILEHAQNSVDLKLSMAVPRSYSITIQALKSAW
jgi:hypothetical protein